jgi:hypothetical protein
MNGANGMSDIEGKAAREVAIEQGREGVSIMKDEMKAKRAPGGRR